MIPVLVEQTEGEVLRYAALGPGFRVRLVAAHHQTTEFFLEVGETVRVTQCGEIARHAGDHVGHDVLVLHRDQRHADAGKRTQLPRPLSGAVHHYLGLDVAERGPQPRHASALLQHGCHSALLDDPHAAHARALGERHGDIGGIGLAIRGQEGRTHQIGDIHHGPEIARLGRREQMHLQPEAVRGGGLAADLGEARRVAGETQSAVAFPAGGEPGFGLEALVELHAVFQQLRDVG